MPSSKDSILFIQHRPRRAGAQVSLSRIVTSQDISQLNPYVLLGGKGWLKSFLDQHEILNQVRPWPSPRSLSSRLGGLSRFANKIIQKLQADGIQPAAIVANDHQECLLALALSRALGKATGRVPVITILRSSGMSLADFKKYNCIQCDQLFARGEELTAQATQWGGRNVTCMLGSFSEDDLCPPLPAPSSFPTKILIAGSENPNKGFSDVLDALKIVELNEPEFPALELVFTGEQTEPLVQLSNQPFRSCFRFAGRIENFTDYARQFQLAIHPSRAESFGMAPLELILAGVPTMISTTGITTELPLTIPWTFPPKAPQDLARSITELWKNWAISPSNIHELQRYILDHYPISHTTSSLAKSIELLTKKP
jgi:hypothetical protein